jgi:hypothetical protein
MTRPGYIAIVAVLCVHVALACTQTPTTPTSGLPGALAGQNGIRR